MRHDLLNHPQIWNGHASGSDERPTSPRLTGLSSQLMLGGGAALLIVLVLMAVVRPEDSRPAALPGIPEEIVEGPMGRVALRDYPDGRRWLSWWRSQKHWAGAPLWVDKPFKELASCAGFEVTIICWNTNQQVRGSEWETSQLFLGTQSMTRAHLLPQPDARPAEIVNNYILDLISQGEPVWYRFGAIQSPPIPSGGVVVQYYQFARLEWPADALGSEIDKVRLTPLGKIATQESWG